MCFQDKQVCIGRTKRFCNRIAIQHQLLGNAGAKFKLVEVFKKHSKTTAKQLPKCMVKTVGLIVAKRLCNKALQLCKEHVGTLLKTTRAVQKLNIKGRDDFGEGCHTTASEPYHYDSAYHPVKRPSAIPVNKDGTCVFANEISNSEKMTVLTLKGNNQPRGGNVIVSLR